MSNYKSRIVKKYSSYFKITYHLLRFFVKNKQFRNLSISEFKKIYKYFFIKESAKTPSVLKVKNLIPK